MSTETENIRMSASVRLPIAFYAQLETEAKEQDLTVGQLIANAVAGLYGVTLPPPPKAAKKYATEEEKKAASADRRKAHKDLVKDLLARYQAEQAAEAGAKG